MLKEAIGIGTTIEEAKNAALKELHAPEEADIKVEVVAMPQKKIFGLFGGSPAKVKASYEIKEKKEAPAKREAPKEKKPAAPVPKQQKKEQPKRPKPEPQTAPQEKKEPVVLQDQGKGKAYLETILHGLGVAGATVKEESNENGVSYTVECEDYGIIIGRRGETLDSIQYLTSLVVNRCQEDYARVTINVGNYRQKREDTLRAVARKNAMNVVRTGRRVTLEPMNPYERRIIHTAVQTVEGASSRSVGSNGDRRVVIELAEGFEPTGQPAYRGGQGSGGRSHGGGTRRSESRPSSPQAPQKSRTQPKVDKAEAPLYGKIDI